MSRSLTRWLAIVRLLSIAALACGCAKSHSGHGHGHELNLIPAEEACPGPNMRIELRVLDSPVLSEDDPIAFVREPAIHWVGSSRSRSSRWSKATSTASGSACWSTARRCSPATCGGFGALPQEHPAGLDLRWNEEYCLFEVGVEQPELKIDRDKPFEFRAPRVHSAILG
jgi:hypothetical protein